MVAVKQRVAAAHPEVGEQDATVIKVDEEVLRTATNVLHRRPRQRCQSFREGVAESLAADEHVFERLALHSLEQALANGLHFG